MQNNQPVSSAYLASHRSSKLITVLLMLTVIGSLFGAANAMADDFRSFGVEISNDDNLSRSQPGEERASTGLSGIYSLGNRKQLSDTSSLNRIYQLGAAYYSAYSGYSNLSAEAQFSYKKKMGLGPDAWWWSGGANAGYAFYSDSDRSNLFITADLSVGKRFGNRVEVAAGYAADMASAGNVVYSIAGQGPEMSIDFTLTEQWLVYANWKSRTGDSWMASSADPGGIDKAPWIPDSTFGGYGAYRKDTTGTEMTYGANYLLGDHSSIDFSYMKRSVQVTGTSSWYYNSIYLISYVRDL
jgi:hypothetical protein